LYQRWCNDDENSRCRTALDLDCAGVQTMKPATTIQQATETHDAANLRYARIVSANLDQYGPAEVAAARNTFTRLCKPAELALMKSRMGGEMTTQEGRVRRADKAAALRGCDVE